MGIALIMPDRDLAALTAALSRRLPGEPIQVWPAIDHPETVTLAVLWRQPPGCLEALTALRAITSYGVGVDGILEDASIDPRLPVGRLVDPGLGPQMAAYVLEAVLHRSLGIDDYLAHQQADRWQPAAAPQTTRVGLLGMGRVGQVVADAFVGLGFPVAAWCRRVRQRPGVTVHAGADGLSEVVAGSDHLVCLLPLTADTRGLLDASLFRRMRPGSQLVHVGRGAQLVEADLLEALDRGRPARARLDVFATEPLPQGHPFWHHPQIEITPHVAALTSPETAAGLIAESYRRVVSGQPPLDPVDRQRGY